MEKSVQIFILITVLSQVYRTMKTDQGNPGNNDNIHQSSGYIASGINRYSTIKYMQVKAIQIIGSV